MQIILIAAILQVFLVALTLNTGTMRLAPGQWMPMGIAVAGMVIAAVLFAGMTA